MALTTEDPPCRCGEGDVFNHDASLFSTHVLGEPVQLGCLADGEDNMIGPDAHGGVFIEQGRETSLLVDDPDARFQFHARDVPVFLKDGAGAEPAMAFA